MTGTGGAKSAFNKLLRQTVRALLWKALERTRFTKGPAAGRDGSRSDDTVNPCYVPGLTIPSTTAGFGLSGLGEGVWGEDARLRALDPLRHSAFSLW